MCAGFAALERLTFRSAPPGNAHVYYMQSVLLTHGKHAHTQTTHTNTRKSEIIRNQSLPHFSILSAVFVEHLCCFCAVDEDDGRQNGTNAISVGAFMLVGFWYEFQYEPNKMPVVRICFHTYVQVR